MVKNPPNNRLHPACYRPDFQSHFAGGIGFNCVILCLPAGGFCWHDGRKFADCSRLGTRKPSGSAVALLRIAEQKPDVFMQLS